MESQKDVVEIVHTLKHVVCVKGSEMELLDTQGKILDFSFVMQEHGWCDWLITHDEYEFVIRLSACFDPFEDIVSWLKSLSDGLDKALKIDEEGHSMKLNVSAENEYDIGIRIVGSHRDKTYLNISVNRDWFCQHLQCEIVRFFKDEFDPFNWDKMHYDENSNDPKILQLLCEDGLKERILNYYKDVV